MLHNYQSQIHDSIRTIINQFHRKPHNFFNEHEFHQYCYHVFYGKKEFSKQFVTLDGKKTNVLHPEYPTLKRFRRKELKVDKSGTRARYDMVILNPDFIQNNRFEKVRCRDISLFNMPEESKNQSLAAAIEFKFIIRHSPHFVHEIEYDLLKLRSADEAGFKYLLVFVTTKDKEMDYFADLDSKGIHIAYVTVLAEGSNKEKVVELQPEGWLEH